MLYERLEFRRKRLKLLAKWQSIFYVVPVMPVWKKLIFSKT